MIGARVTLRRTTLSSLSIRLRLRSGPNIAKRSGGKRPNSCIARSKPSGECAQRLHTDSRRFGKFRQIISGILYGASRTPVITCATSHSRRTHTASERTPTLSLACDPSPTTSWATNSMSKTTRMLVVEPRSPSTSSSKCPIFVKNCTALG